MDWKLHRVEAVVILFEVPFRLLLEKLKKDTKHHGQDNRRSG